MAQFPDEPFEERLDLLNQPMMWCLACGKPVAHQTKSFVASHLTRRCHIAGKAHIAKQKAKKEAVAKQKDEEVVAMQRVSTLRQPTLGHVVSYHAERFAVQDDLVFAMLAFGIPVEKLDHPIMRAFLRKYTSVSGCLSQLGGEFPKHNCSRLQEAHQKKQISHQCVWGLGPRSWSLGSCVAEKPHAMQQVVLFGSSLLFAAFFRIFPHFFRFFPHFFIFPPGWRSASGGAFERVLHARCAVQSFDVPEVSSKGLWRPFTSIWEHPPKLFAVGLFTR